MSRILEKTLHNAARLCCEYIYIITKIVMRLNWQVLKVMVKEGEIDKERWKLPFEEKEEEEDEFWGFEDLEYDECNSSSTSLQDDCPLVLGDAI